MKVAAITVRAGNVLEQDGKLWIVLKSEIFNPGKGASVVQVEMRDLRSGNKTNERYRTQETVERVSLDESEYAFLFAEGDEFTFMNQETFEQMTIPRDIIGYPAAFLILGSFAVGSVAIWFWFSTSLKVACATKNDRGSAPLVPAPAA